MFFNKGRYVIDANETFHFDSVDQAIKYAGENLRGKHVILDTNTHTPAEYISVVVNDRPIGQPKREN